MLNNVKYSLLLKITGSFNKTILLVQQRHLRIEDYRSDYSSSPSCSKVDNAIHRINLYPSNGYCNCRSLILIYWIVIYPMDSAIQLLNYRGLVHRVHSEYC